MTSPATQQTGGPVFRLLYRSHDLVPEADRRREFGTIFTAARSTNKKLGITGALLLPDDTSVQVLEGDEAAVRGLLARIEADPRHDDLVVLEAGTVDARVFDRWAMARVSVDGDPDIPLIAGERGITVAAGRGRTPEQEALLDVMREVANGQRHEV